MESQSSWYIDTDYGPTQALNPFSIDDGALSITAQTVPAHLQPSINGYDYASGLLPTYDSFSQTYGYFEIRADMPEGEDRKSVVEGKRVSVRVDLGGRRIIKKKNKQQK